MLQNRLQKEVEACRLPEEVLYPTHLVQQRPLASRHLPAERKARQHPQLEDPTDLPDKVNSFKHR